MHTHTPLPAIATLLVPLLLAACSTDSMEELRAYVDEIHARPGERLEPFAIALDDTGYAFQGAGRDPFEPFEAGQTPPPIAIADPPREAVEELEAYALDSLRLVGTLERDGDVWGLVYAPDGVIHRVRAGNYLGRNHGRIIAVAESGLELREMHLRDGQWLDREASLPLGSS